MSLVILSLSFTVFSLGLNYFGSFLVVTHKEIYI